MTSGPGSMVLPMQGTRHSTRSGRGLNGRDAQLDRLGDILTAPTRQAPKRFAPTDGLDLPNNVLAPAPKRRRRNKKVLSNYSSFSTILTDPKTAPPPPATPQPCQEPLPNIDPRLGFLTPRPQFTLSPLLPQHEAPTQPLSLHATRYSSPHLSVTPPTRQPPAHPPLPGVGLTPELDDSGSDDSDADGIQNHEPDIDERSDDEDDRAAHELLRATPTAVHDSVDPLTILPYNHQGFVVCLHLSFHPAMCTYVVDVGIRQRQLRAPSPLCTEPNSPGSEPIPHPPCPSR